MKNNKKKIIMKLNIIFIITVLLLLLNSTIHVQAIDIYKSPGTIPGGLGDLGNGVYWIAQAIGVAVGVFVIAIIGVKYIIAAPEGKAEIKKQLIMYVIGAILIGSAAWIVSSIITAAYFT